MAEAPATVAPVYRALQERLEKSPIGAPAHPALFDLLEQIFTPEEARIASLMPMKLASSVRLAKLAGMTPTAVQPVLDAMVEKALLFDLQRKDGRTYYFLNPTVIGFFEFTMMRVRDDLDQDRVARDMWTYFREDPDLAFAKMLFAGPTFIARPLAHEDVLPPNHSEVLDYERATAIVEEATAWGEGLCHCRHVKARLGKRCDYPLDHCMSLGTGAEYLIRTGKAKRIDKARALEILAYARDHGAVHMADNVKNRPTFICNCCSCCCEMLEGIRTLKNREAIITSGWLATPRDATCNGCGKCVKACPVEAMELEDAGPVPAHPRRRKRARVRPDTCLGCGVCIRECRHDALALERLPARIYTPESMMEKVMVQALERGKLQHLLFDDPSRLTHKVGAALLGLVLKLPPAQTALAGQQVKSKFVRVLLDGVNKSPMAWMTKV